MQATTELYVLQRQSVDRSSDTSHFSKSSARSMLKQIPWCYNPFADESLGHSLLLCALCITASAFAYQQALISQAAHCTYQHAAALVTFCLGLATPCMEPPWQSPPPRLASEQSYSPQTRQVSVTAGSSSIERTAGGGAAAACKCVHAAAEGARCPAAGSPAGACPSEGHLPLPPCLHVSPPLPRLHVTPCFGSWTHTGEALPLDRLALWLRV